MKKYKNFFNSQRGASLLEVILAIALSLMLIPFMYNQIADMNSSVKDIAIANKIVKSRDDVINYVRLNMASFDNEDGDGIEIDSDDLREISPLAHSGVVFKTDTQGAEYIEVFLAYAINSDYETANIAKYIGDDAAIVSDDNIAWSQNWAIGGVEDFNFYPGNLIFRIVHNFGGDDKNKFLHRGAIWNDDEDEIGDLKLNQMQRNLDMGMNSIYNIATIRGNELGKAPNAIGNIITKSLNAYSINAGNIYFEQPLTLKLKSGDIPKYQGDDGSWPPSIPNPGHLDPSSNEDDNDVPVLFFRNSLHVDEDVYGFENVSAQSLRVDGNMRVDGCANNTNVLDCMNVETRIEAEDFIGLGFNEFFYREGEIGNLNFSENKISELLTVEKKIYLLGDDPSSNSCLELAGLSLRCNDVFSDRAGGDEDFDNFNVGGNFIIYQGGPGLVGGNFNELLKPDWFDPQ